MSKLVLIIDDSELIVSMLEMICGQLGYRTASALAFAQVDDLVSKEAPAVVLTDLNMPDVPENDPVQGLRTIPALSQTPIIVVSGMPQGELDEIAKTRGAQGAISKDAGLPGMMMQLGPMLEGLVP